VEVNVDSVLGTKVIVLPADMGLVEAIGVMEKKSANPDPDPDRATATVSGTCKITLTSECCSEDTSVCGGGYGPVYAVSPDTTSQGRMGVYAQNGRKRMIRGQSFDVKPRYSGGSPALVDEATARRVAAQEKDMIVGYLEGIYGEAEKLVAETMGLAWIVWFSSQKGNTVTREDVITGDKLTIKHNSKSISTPAPLYASTQPEFQRVQTQLRLNGVQFEIWDGAHKEGTDEFSFSSFQWVVVSANDLKVAEQVLGWMQFKPMPPYLTRSSEL
jgi:hypothetical protein